MIDSEFLTWKNPTGAEPVPSEPDLNQLYGLPNTDKSESALIYVAQNDTYLSPNSDLMAGKGVNDDASLSFEAGKSYRVRIINMAALASKYPNIC